MLHSRDFQPESFDGGRFFSQRQTESRVQETTGTAQPQKEKVVIRLLFGSFVASEVTLGIMVTQQATGTPVSGFGIPEWSLFGVMVTVISLLGLLVWRTVLAVIPRREATDAAEREDRMVAAVERLDNRIANFEETLRVHEASVMQMMRINEKFMKDITDEFVKEIQKGRVRKA